MNSTTRPKNVWICAFFVFLIGLWTVLWDPTKNKNANATLNHLHANANIKREDNQLTLSLASKVVLSAALDYR